MKARVDVEIIEDSSELEGRKRTAKGWFDPRTGKICIVLGNHSSSLDIQATLLHEMVAHKGLRDLFGAKFDAFLDAVYANAEDRIKEQIDVLAIKNGWNRRVATEEYLAGLAEDAQFADIRGSWWQKLKALFMDFLRGCGFSPNVKISDNELRYVLWMSWKNIQEPGAFRSFLGMAERIAKEDELKVGNFAETTEKYQDQESQTTLSVAESEPTKELNERFNRNLERFENGELAEDFRFDLGMPSKYLLGAGFPNLPISMRQSLLKKKAAMERHPFSATHLKGLVEAIQKPLAIFEYSKPNMRNLIIDLKEGDKHFLVGVTLNYKAGDIEINSVSGLFPKDNAEWLKWIQQGKAIRIDGKEIIQAIIDSQRTTNTVESERIGLNLDDAAKIVKNFENPIIEEGILFRDARLFHLNLSFSWLGSLTLSKIK